LILSQVILSLQLPFAVVPLIKFTSSKTKMGPFVSKLWVQIAAWVIAGVIIVLNVVLVVQEIGAWTHAAGNYGWLVLVGTVPVGSALGVLLLWMIFHSDGDHRKDDEPANALDVLSEARVVAKPVERVGVALEAKQSDAAMLARAISLAKTHGAQLVLIHIVEGVGGQWYGQQTGDLEARQDEAYLDDLVRQFKCDQSQGALSDAHAVLGYGDVARELVRIVDDERIDLLVVGGHGHKGLGDVLHGQTIPGVRHGIDIPIFAVRG